MHRYIIVFFLLLTHTLFAEDDYFVLKDLKSDWLVYQTDRYHPYDGTSRKDSHSIYFMIPSSRFRGNDLVVSCQCIYSLFVDGTLAHDSKSESIIGLDSLTNIFGEGTLMVAIHSDRPLSAESVQTYIGLKFPEATVVDGPIPRVKNAFQDFVVFSTLLLITSLIILLRTNPKQGAHFFSLFKLFSLRESDDTQAFNKIISGTNVLYYGFTAMLVALVAMVLLQGAPTGFLLFSEIEFGSFLENMWGWLKLSTIIFVVLVIKALVVSLLSSLYTIQDYAGLQFLNFIRIMILTMVLIGVIGITYFITNGDGAEVYLILYQANVWIMMGWIILIFLKLTRRASFSPIQLISYLCATEIVPFLVLTKFLYD